MPGGKNIKHKKSRMFLILAFFMVSLAIIFAAAYGYYNGTIYKPISLSGEAKKVEIAIDASSAGQVVETLYHAGLIKDKNTLKVFLRLSGLSSKLKAGKYEFNTGMSAAEIVNKMVRGEVKRNTIRVTIPEGYTVSDIAEVLSSKGLVDREEFLNTVKNGNFDYDFLNGLPQRSGKLEGYLFPDTYEFAKDASPEQIIKKMLDRFDDVFDEDMRNKAKNMKMTVDQVVTVASMIEKEAKVAEERPIISAVIYNRLKLGMRLQIDATVQYALGQWNEKVYTEDTKVDSPYNTYAYGGLPVGPISNPGKASLEAALNPEKVDYLYYVAKGDGSGSHAFTVTYEEFLNEKHKNR